MSTTRYYVAYCSEDNKARIKFTATKKEALTIQKQLKSQGLFATVHPTRKG